MTVTVIRETGICEGWTICAGGDVISVANGSYPGALTEQGVISLKTSEVATFVADLYKAMAMAAGDCLQKVQTND